LSSLKSGANATNNIPVKKINGKNYHFSGYIKLLNEKIIDNINTKLNIVLCE
jgi:hypothetical protein